MEQDRKPERGLLSLDPDRFNEAAAAQEEAWLRAEWPLLHGDGENQWKDTNNS
jgi:hypothetical protein